MRTVFHVLIAAVPSLIATTIAASAACDVAALKLEDMIAQKTELQNSANKQTVRDLRTLRDAAIVLQAYKYEPECERILAIVKTLTANPEHAIEQSGDTDEEKAEEIEEAREPKSATKPPAKPK